jgi:hypothetical protein
MTERILAGVAVLTLFGFLGVLLWHVPRLDLTAVVAFTAVLVVRDLFARQGS